MPTLDDLHYLQSLPLELKVAMTQTRIREWVNYYGISGVFVSFSGGAYDNFGVWKPDSRGLGMAHVIDELCRLYGNDFIKY